MTYVIPALLVQKGEIVKIRPGHIGFVTETVMDHDTQDVVITIRHAYDDDTETVTWRAEHEVCLYSYRDLTAALAFLDGYR